MEPTTVVARPSELRERLDGARARGQSVGLVPTMGAFHEGHLTLMRRARTAHDLVVVSLFVNPLQFGPTEDLDSYPGDLDADLALARNQGVDILFAPAVEDMYPGGAPLTTVHVADLGDHLCGEARPGHFDGVATVVTKLFALAGPVTAYFGRKDAQQLAIVRRLVSDLCLPIQIEAAPLVREPDGLALSSRNRNLGPAERQAAAVLHRALCSGAELVKSGERDAGRIRRVVANVATTEELVRLEYAQVVDATTLVPVEEFAGEVLVAVAARVGAVRLIDNMTVHVDGAEVAIDLGVTVAPLIEGGSPCVVE